MESLVLAELEKQKNELRKMFQEKIKDSLKPEELDFIVSSLDRCIFSLFDILRERKSAHEKFFSDIILNSPDAIAGYDKDGKMFLWNKGAENIFGFNKMEILGKNFDIILPGESRDGKEIAKLEKEIEKNGFVSNYETKRLTKSGEIKNVTLSMFNVLNEKNELIGKVSIIRDITNEKNLEKELREKENLALIGTVVSSIAHNLSNPLNIISGNADYLLLDRKENDEGFEELNVILQETTRITKAIRQILNFSRPVRLTKELTDINKLIKSVIDSYVFTISKENKEIEIITDLNKNLPEINLDKDQFGDVISNLVNNSVQAIKDKGKILIKTYSGNESAVIEISDNGVGIKPDVINKIFIPFFSTKEYGKGTGLGLAFSERVIKQHKGKISVKSIPGKSTTFTISIPQITNNQ